MRVALAKRDIAGVYRLLQRQGVSQRRIAAWTGQSQSEISEILGGRQVLAYDVLVRIATGLGIRRGRLGLAYDADVAAPLTEPIPKDIPLPRSSYAPPWWAHEDVTGDS